jgi:hypothetical protein
MDAAQADTWSLACGPCPYREKLVTFTSSNVNTWIRLWTGCGSSTGTFQIDLDNECYTPDHPPALGCAAASEDHPRHKVCQSQTCVEVNGYGANECSSNSDCVVVQTHLECSSMACVEITGSGTDQCTQDCDCYHMECINEACVRVNGDGTDQCTQNTDCYYYDSHYECVGNSCEEVPGPGVDECLFKWDCQPLPV